MGGSPSYVASLKVIKFAPILDTDEPINWIPPLPTGQHGISKAMRNAKRQLEEEKEAKKKQDVEKKGHGRKEKETDIKNKVNGSGRKTKKDKTKQAKINKKKYVMTKEVESVKNTVRKTKEVKKNDKGHGAKAKKTGSKSVAVQFNLQV